MTEKEITEWLCTGMLVLELTTALLIVYIRGRQHDQLIKRMMTKQDRRLLMWVRRTKASGVYFIDNGEAIKIGVSKDIASRFQHLQTASNRSLSIVAVIPGAGPSTERDLHRRFSHLRLEGEWFQYNRDLLLYVYGLPRAEDR